MNTKQLILLTFFFSNGAFAVSELPEVVITDEAARNLPLKKEEINRVERLRPQDLQKKQAQTFTQLMNNERGVDSQTSCAFCGAKRLTINGMKGEHTTILIDGLPLHSTVSGFYGVEAIPLGGIDSIDIYRGAGAALTTPESIGGAINILTADIVDSRLESNVSLANDGQRNYSVLGTRKIGDRVGILLGVQYGEMQPLDLDGNGVSEIPRQTTQSFISKFSYKIDEGSDISLRYGNAQLKTIGGTMSQLNLSESVPTLANSDDFEDRDVRKKFHGDEAKITDNVQVKRQEAALIYKKQLNEISSLKLSLGSAWQEQDAIYSHGYDYGNKDRLSVGMAEYQRVLNDEHLFTLGLDVKNQEMKSHSDYLYVRSRLAKDDLKYESFGGFLQDTWIINDAQELSAVLRYDKIKTRWQDLNRQIEESVLAPRLMYKHVHNSILTSRVSGGLGYRSPLTLFESEHGTNHYGFVLDIDRLERAQSLVYSLSGQWHDDFFEVSSHFTKIENMAYGLDRANLNAPTVFKNSDETYLISNYDFSYGRRFSPFWNMEGIFEIFDYPDKYKAKLPVAAIEKRFSLTSNLEWGKWRASQKLTVIGERDLSSYGYDKHYNVAYADDDVLSPTFGETFSEDQKRQKSPTFFTLDLNFERDLNDFFSASFAVLNLFDYTQTGAGDSPTTWHIHGTHYHLDNFHIWGPLRGRQFFVNLKAQF